MLNLRKTIGAIAIVATIASSSIASATERIPSNKAPFHVGESIMVCGRVAAVKELNKRTVINLGRNYPNEDIGLLIWNDAKSGFEARFGNLSWLANKQVCATGTIEVYKNHLEIIMKNSMMLRLME